MKLSRTISIELFSRFGRAVASLAAISVFLSELGAGTFGNFVLFQATVTVVGISVDLGIGSAVQKRATEIVDSPVLSTAVCIKTGLLLLVGMGIMVGAPVVQGFLGSPLSIHLVVAIALQQFGRLGLHALRGDLRVAEASIVQLGGDVLLLAVGYALTATGFGLLGLVYAFFVQWLFITVLSAIRLNYSPRAPSTAIARSLFDFSKYTFVSSVIGGTLYGWMDTLVIGFFFSPSAVAVYEAAWQVARVVSLVSQSIGTALFPQVSDWQLGGQTSEIRHTVREAITGSLVIVFPAVVGAWLFGVRLLDVFFGPEAAAGGMALVVLLLGKVPESVNDVVGRTLYGLNRPDYTAYAATLFVAINIGLNFVLVPYFGIEGAAVATSLAFAVNAGINVVFLSQLVPINPDLRTIGYCLIASVCMGMGLWLVDWYHSVEAMVPLIGIVSLGVVLYSLVLLVPSSIRYKLGKFARQVSD